MHYTQYVYISFYIGKLRCTLYTSKYDNTQHFKQKLKIKLLGVKTQKRKDFFTRQFITVM